MKRNGGFNAVEAILDRVSEASQANNVGKQQTRKASSGSPRQMMRLDMVVLVFEPKILSLVEIYQSADEPV